VSFQGTLRPYQEEAKYQMVNRGQMLLGMVMGAGKTPTTIAATEELADDGEITRCLIIVPSSLKYQWKKELAKFAPRASVAVIDGSKARREKQWRLSISSRYVICNAESLLKDEKKVGKYDAVVVDEATIIKTRNVKRSRLIKRLGKKVLYRFALTGQPIENRPEELFSIMEFVDRDVLGNFQTFDNTFIVRDHWGKPVRYRNLDVMNNALEDVLIRKTYDDIKDQLPDIIKQVIAVPFDAKGAKVYNRISDDLLDKLGAAIRKGGGGFNLWAHYNGGEDAQAQGEIMTRLTTLRMICDNPKLVRLSAANFDNPHIKAGSQYASTIVQEGWLTDVKATPKLDVCLEYIEEVLTEDPKNKVVLFSFFKANLALLELKLAAKGFESVPFMGGMTSKEKDESKEEFASNPDCRVFLSSDAGGYGVDLPMANYLISYDLPWSSGKLEQREARIIRLSSEFPHVTIATFVMEGSIEERQYEMLQHKKNVNEAFIDGRHQDVQKGMDVDVDSLTTFLRESRV